MSPFARELKAIPAPADAPVKDLRSNVEQWHDRARAFIRSPFEECWFDFTEGWEKIKFPAGKGPIDMAFAKVLESDLPAAAEQYEQRELRLLVGLCWELQCRTGVGQPFFLACRTASGLLGVDHSTASRWLRGLKRDEIIRLAEPGSRRDRKAHRYRYVAGDLQRMDT